MKPDPGRIAQQGTAPRGMQERIGLHTSMQPVTGDKAWTVTQQLVHIQ